MVITRRGTGRRCVTAVAATASGGETIAPSTNAAAHGRSGTIQCATAATAQVVNSTSPMASSEIGRRLALKSRQLVSSAA
jgi:hypothetical protein